MEKFPKNALQRMESKENKVETPEIKEGVDFAFEQNSALEKIGTKEEYSKYLDNVFPESKVKNIVYHSTQHDFEEFDINRGDLGVHFADKDVSSGIKSSEYTKQCLINIENPLRLTDEGAFHFAFLGEKLVELGILTEKKFFEINNSNLSVQEENAALREWLLSKGFDGIVYLNRREGIDDGILNSDEFQKCMKISDIEFKKKYSDAIDSYIVFKPDSINVLGSKKDIDHFSSFALND